MKRSFINRFGIAPVFAGLLYLCLDAPAIGQDTFFDPGTDGQTETGAQFEQADTQNEGLRQTARNADTGIGEVGVRQTMNDAATLQEPLDRIASRINNRVENRIRNRIDRNYDPTANATSPYEVADSQNRADRISGPR